MAGKQEAEVLFDYEKTQDDELSLKVGDILQDVVQVDEGWCEGTLNGARGMFPDNFVKLRPAQTTPAAAPPPAQPPITTRETGGAIKNRRAKVAFSYVAENTDELSLEPGQMVEIIDEEEEGWFRGRMNGKEGVFPSNFLDLTTVTEAPPSQPTPEPARPEEPPASKQPVMGHKLFPSINPALARANLKSSAEKKPAPTPPVAAEKKEKAKVTFEYKAENDDELTINVGEMVEVLDKNTDQDGWWKVKLGDRVGLVPDNFVELLAASTTPTHPPPPTKARAPPPMPSDNKPPLKEAHPPKPQPPRAGSVSRPTPPQPDRPPPPVEPKATPSVKEELTDENSDFGVPHTDPLDSSAMKDRPKRNSRPPSRSNLQTGEGHETSPEPKPEKPAPAAAGLSPWQAELQKRKAHKPPPPTPGSRPPTAPKKAVKPPEKPAARPPTTKPQASTRPHPEPMPPPSRDTPSPHQPPTPSPPTPTPTPHMAAAPPPDDSWKEAYEKLRDDFDKFKAYVEKQFKILTSDLDEERKHWRGLEVDIDRLKKQSSFSK